MFCPQFLILKKGIPGNTYNIGGNVTSGAAGTDLTFSEFGFLFGINDISNMSGSSLGSEVDMYII